MNKSTAFLWFLLIAIGQNSIAQDIHPRMVSYKKTSVFVFPFRVQSNYESDPSVDRIMPITVSLPDGNYLAYYTKRHLTRNNFYTSEHYNKRDTTRVAALFKILHNQKTDSA